MTFLIGTAHFVSLAKAAQYYRDYEDGDGYETVMEKLSMGEIRIGPPALPARGKLVLLDNGTRYGVEESAMTHEPGAEMKRVIEHWEFSNMSDLSDIIDKARFAAQINPGMGDSPVIYVVADVDSSTQLRYAHLVSTTLTDGSEVFDLVLS